MTQLRITKKSFCSFWIFFFTVIFGCATNNAAICMGCAAIQVIMVCWKAGLSFMSAFCFIVNYSLLPQYIAYTGGNVYGLLGLGYIKIYFFELCYCCYALNTVIYAFIVFTSFIQNERKVFKKDYNFSYTTVILLSITAILLTLLIFPDMSFGFDGENRFDSGIISFSGWSCIPFFLLSLGLLSKKRKKTVYSATGFVCLWYMMHGERVDVVGMLFFFAMVYFHSKKRRKQDIISVALVGMFLVAVLLAIGSWRGGDSFSIQNLISSIVVQSTVCDVTNVFNASVDTFYKGNVFGGITYLSYLINCIPRMPDSYSFQCLIGETYRSAGGGLFFAEPIANFGFILTSVEILLFVYFVYYITKKQTKYRSLIYAELCLSIFRSAWYGLNYPIVTILYFIPAVLLLNKFTWTVSSGVSCNFSNLS